jgi:hypothetical protein
VWVVAIGKAGQRRAEAQLAALGKGLVWISAGSRNIEPAGAQLRGGGDAV